MALSPASPTSLQERSRRMGRSRFPPFELRYFPMVVTADTDAIDSRLISRSTLRRSSWTRSSISLAVRDCPSLLNPIEVPSVAVGFLCWQTQPLKVGCCGGRQDLEIFTAKLGQTARRVHHIGRFVALSPIGNGRQIGRIGLHQQPVQGNQFGGFMNIHGLRICDDSRKAEIAIEIDSLARLRRSTGKTMQDARQIG